MPDPRRDLTWADQAEDDDEQPSPYEPTYRDGSVKNECWRDEP